MGTQAWRDFLIDLPDDLGQMRLEDVSILREFALQMELLQTWDGDWFMSEDTDRRWRFHEVLMRREYRYLHGPFAQQNAEQAVQNIRDASLYRQHRMPKNIKVTYE